MKVIIVKEERLNKRTILDIKKVLCGTITFQYLYMVVCDVDKYDMNERKRKVKRTYINECWRSIYEERFDLVSNFEMGWSQNDIRV